MTHSPSDSAPAAPPAAPRPNSDYRWTPAKALAFLDALAQCGKVAEAARAVGMTRQSAYRLKRRAPKFAGFWPQALAKGKERRRARGRRRGAGHGSPQGYASGAPR